MKKVDFNQILKGAQAALRKHSPEILTGIGIAGMLTTTVLAVKATPKALMLIEEKKLDLDTEKLHPVEVVKTVWPCYIPSVATGAMSVACLIGASTVNFRRNAALTTAYAISETALKDYQEKVIETIGEKKESAVRDAIAKNKIEKNPVEQNTIVVTDKGESLCYEPLSGRYFRSDIEKIRAAINNANYMLLNDNYISLNDFYCEIGLEETKTGEQIGWSIEKGQIEPYFSTQLANGEPCLVVDFVNPPVYDYNRYY